jgi:hypothetical protein
MLAMFDGHDLAIVVGRCDHTQRCRGRRATASE